MKLAIMQPYFLPYIGYWQLLHAADRFVVLDDVNYIKAGWINRNRILINGRPVYLTVPVRNASQNRRICDTLRDLSGGWSDLAVKTLATAYRRAPFFGEVFPVLERIIRHDAANLADYLTNQLQALATFMGIDTAIVASSCGYGNARLRGEARIVDICRCEGATEYLNLPGGAALYDPATFAAAGVALRFLSPQTPPYPQRSPGFTPSLSIADVLMEVGRAGMRPQLDAFTLASKGAAA